MVEHKLHKELPTHDRHDNKSGNIRKTHHACTVFIYCVRIRTEGEASPHSIISAELSESSEVKHRGTAIARRQQLLAHMSLRKGFSKFLCIHRSCTWSPMELNLNVVRPLFSAY